MYEDDSELILREDAGTYPEIMARHHENKNPQINLVTIYTSKKEINIFFENYGDLVDFCTTYNVKIERR